ncbi:STAS domain-containing protein [Streptomyces sp. NPDC088785]|uniref:STAS domain-containing protein n=1 Tax=Streptomyces sp. NPDC088785 TaxID=3365897 RepID=UPI0037F4E322
MNDIPEAAVQPSARLSITRASHADAEVLTAAGEIDASTIPLLSEALSGASTATAGGARTVLDLSAVTFMDSTGINALLTGHRAAEEAGGWLRLAGLDGPVWRVVELVGVHHVLSCHPSVAEALDA